MIDFPHCKINLGLNILSKRADGYHDLETVFYPVALRDALEIIPAAPGNSDLKFQSSGLPIEGSVQGNLCVKAVRLLQVDFPRLPPVQIHLHKIIPMGAGLGGGSSDAAFTLSMINRMFQLDLSGQQLMHYALQLGSDCPYFLMSAPCLAKGRGELLSPIHIDLSSYKLLLVYPGIHVNTGEAFAALDPGRARQAEFPADIVQRPVSQWKEALQNDFEPYVFRTFPEIASLKAALYEQGALYASLSGSGSTVYGLFEKDSKPVLQFPEHYFYSWI